MSYKTVKMAYATTQFIAIQFYGAHVKPHVVRGLSKNYHLRLYPKLGLGKFAIRQIHCACVACANILDKAWDPGVSHSQKPCYQPVVDCTYWPMLGSFNNWNSTKLANKTMLRKKFDKVHRVVLDCISEKFRSWCRQVNTVLSMQKILQKFDFFCDEYIRRLYISVGYNSERSGK